MVKVSVIIPVYNTEKYLRKCLDSVCGQTLSDIEIICINDCSTDGSLQILQEYAANDNRIKLIDFEKNQGAATARNKGLDIAQGEYIGFVDPDDFIDLNFYKKLYQKAEDTDADVVKGTIHTVFDENAFISEKTRIIAQNEQKMMDELHQKISLNKVYFRCMFTTALYNRIFMNKYNIRFIENCICGEDLIVPIKSAAYANDILLVDDAKYFYLRRENSATTSNTTKNLKNIILMQKNILYFLNNAPIDEDQYKYLADQYVNLRARYEMFECYHKKDFDSIKELALIHRQLKYKDFDEKEYFDLIEDYLKFGDVHQFISKLKFLEKDRIFGILRKKLDEK